MLPAGAISVQRAAHSSSDVRLVSRVKDMALHSLHRLDIALTTAFTPAYALLLRIV